jgi:hypothetical protein
MAKTIGEGIAAVVAEPIPGEVNVFQPLAGG